MKSKYSIRFYNSDGSYSDNNVEKTEYTCPNCGHDHVYEATGEGDYYEGTTLYCKNCDFVFTMPSRGVEDSLNWVIEDKEE